MITGTEFEAMPLEEIIRKSQGAMFNNAAQVWNHTFYWNCLKPPKGGGEPPGKLADAINKAFGSFAKFKEEFTDTAIKTFGSGWAWLVQRPDGSLALVSTSNAATPLTGDDIAAADLRRVGTRVLHRLPQRAPEVRRGVLEPGQLGLRRVEHALSHARDMKTAGKPAVFRLREGERRDYPRQARDHRRDLALRARAPRRRVASAARALRDESARNVAWPTLRPARGCLAVVVPVPAGFAEHRRRHPASRRSS